MSRPTWQKVDGPPPGISKSDGPPPRARAPKPAPRPAPQSWPAPTTPPIMTLPPPEVQRKVVHPPPKMFQSEYTCLSRPGNDQLTDCGRLLFIPAVKATDNVDEVTCMFCKSRIANGTARVLH